jgi:hypothetical protein
MADGFNPFRVGSGTSATVGFAPQSGASPTAIQNSSPSGDSRLLKIRDSLFPEQDLWDC